MLSKIKFNSPYSALKTAAQSIAIAADDTTCGTKRTVLKTFHPLDRWDKSNAIIRPNGTVISAAVMHQYRLFVIALTKLFLLNNLM